IGAGDAAIARDRTVGTTVRQTQQRPLQCRTLRTAAMDLVATDRCAWHSVLLEQPSLDLAQQLARRQSCLHFEPAEPGAAAGWTFDAIRIVHLLSEHLQSTADAEQATTPLQM